MESYKTRSSTIINKWKVTKVVPKTRSSTIINKWKVTKPVVVQL